MSLQGIRLVTFDATNTLLKFRVAPWIHYTNVARQYGFKGTEQQVHQRFYENYKLVWKYYPNFGSDNIGWRMWWTHVIKRTFREHFELAGSLDKLSEHLIEDFKTSKCWAQADSASELISNLRDRNIGVGIISNFDPRLHNVLNEVGFDRNNFEFVLTSYAAKCMKPNPDIFNLALKECRSLDTEDITAAEAMHIGDDYENDYCAARYAGWKSALILADKPLPQPVEDGSVFKSLAEFNNFLLSRYMKTANALPVLDLLTPPSTDKNNNIEPNQAPEQTAKSSTMEEEGTVPKMYQAYPSKMQTNNTTKMAHNGIVTDQECLAGAMEMGLNESLYGFTINDTGSQYEMERSGLQTQDSNSQQGMCPNYSAQQSLYGYDNNFTNQQFTYHCMPQNDSADNNQQAPGYQWCPNQQYVLYQQIGDQGDGNQNINNEYYNNLSGSTKK